MRLLVISQFFPYPPINGGKMRVYQLIRGLSVRHRVHLLSFSSSPSDLEHVSHLQAFCEEIDVVPERPFRPLSPRALMAFASPAPRSYVTSWSPEMMSRVDSQMRAQRFDAAIALGLRNAAYLARYDGVPTVVDNENCDSAYAARLADEAQSSLLKFRRKLTWVKSRQYESKLASKFHAALVVCEEDRRSLAGIAPALESRGAIHTIPNGTDLSLLDYRGPEVDPYAIISPGALTYSANYDAAAYFCENIFPAIKDAIPRAKLMITGGTGGVNLAPFQGKPGVTLTGYLDDVRPAIAGSAVVIVPTRIGGGTRLKVLEAMALGTPVVATSFGAMGLGAKHGEDILIGDTPAEFAQHVCAVMQDRELRDKITANARRFVAAGFGWDSIVGSLNRVLESIAEPPKDVE